MRRLATCIGLALVAAAPAAAQILGPDAAACKPGSGRDAVLLTVDGFKNLKGELRVELWPANDRDFMRDHNELLAEGKTYQRVTVPVPTSGVAKVCVPLPGPGLYALGAFHTPSGVNKFNFRDDGATFTRNPKVGIFKTRPRAEEVAMQFTSGLNESRVTMNYLRGLGFGPVPQADLPSMAQK